MNDLETDLRHMFNRRDADLPWSVQPPPGISRRVRRRQARTALIAAGTTLALVATLVMGYRELTDRTGTYVPAAETRGSTTSYAAGVAITYPSSWHLTVYTDTKGLRQKVVLTNFEVDPRNDDPCAAMPAHGAVLLIQPDRRVSGDVNPQPWPADLQPAAAPAHCTGNGQASVWSTPVGRTFAAQAFLGPAASEDRTRLVEAFSSMTFQAFGEDVSGAGAVLASGVIDNRPWTLFAGPGQSPEGPSLHLNTTQEGGGLSGTGFGVVEVSRPEDVALSAQVMHGNMFLFGGAPAEVARVRVSPDNADAFDVPLYRLPTSLNTSIREFVAPMLGAPRGTLTTYDGSGAVLSEVHFSPGESCWWPDNPCEGMKRIEGPLAEGKVGDTRWELVEQGGVVQLLDEEGEVLGLVEGTPDPLLVSAVTIGTGSDAVQIPFGIASPETTSVVFFTSGLPSDASTAVLADGRVVFWAPVSPPAEDGQILVFDANCRLLGAVLINTGKPPAVPAPTDCGT